MEDYEKKLVSEANSAKTQWKLPDLSIICKAIFMSDHYTWMWQPSSLLFILLSHTILKYTEERYSSPAALPVAMIMPCIVLYWTLGTMFYVADLLTGQEGKDFKTRTTVPMEKILAVVAKNHVLTTLTFPLMIYIGYNWLSPYPALKVSEDSVLWFIWSYFLDGFIFEVIFWSGHYLEHLFPELYRDYHLLHHTTKSDVAFSGYYMTFVDYCLEGLFPMYICLLISAWFQLSTVAVAATIMLNYAYAPIVHSGWTLPGFPDPGDHWLHHTKVAPRGQGINYGTHFNLMDDAMETHEHFDIRYRSKKKQ